MTDVRSSVDFLNRCKLWTDRRTPPIASDDALLQALQTGGFIEVHDKDSLKKLCGIGTPEEAERAAVKLAQLQRRLESALTILFALRSGLRAILTSLLLQRHKTAEELRDEIRSELLALEWDLKTFQSAVPIRRTDDTVFVRLTPQGLDILRRFPESHGADPTVPSPIGESDILELRGGFPIHQLLTIREINEAAKLLSIKVTAELLNVAARLDHKLFNPFGFRPTQNNVVVIGRANLLANCYLCQAQDKSYEFDCRTLALAEDRRLMVAAGALDAPIGIDESEFPVEVKLEAIIVGSRPPTEDEQRAYETMGWSYNDFSPVSAPEMPIYDGFRATELVVCRLRQKI